MKHTYIFGTVVVCILLVLGITFGLVAAGLFGGEAETLVFSSGSAEGIYNAEGVRCAEWKLEKGTLQEGHTASVTMHGVQTDVGESKNLFSVTIRDENGADVSYAYSIEYMPGTLKVLPRLLQLIADNATKQYDGTPLSCSTYKIFDGELVEGHSLQVTMAATRTEVGQVENPVIAQVFDTEGNEVTHNYQIETLAGDLTVTPHAVTFQSQNAQKVYDGEALVWEQAELVGGDLMEGHTYSIVYTGTQTDAGESENTFAVVIKDENGKDVTANYAITAIFGTLEVQKIEVTVRTGDAAKDYDGDALVYDFWEVVSETTVLEGHTLKVVVSGTRTEVGESKNVVAEYIVTDSKGNNVTKNYDFDSEQFGVLVVRDVANEDGTRPLVITTENATKIYDGLPLENPGYKLTEPGENVGLKPGHSIKIELIENPVNAGTYDNQVLSVEITDEEGYVVNDQYDIQKRIGKLVIEQRPITVSSNSAEKAYDGTPLTSDGFTKTANGKNEGLLEGHTLSAAVTGTITEIGQVENTISNILIQDAEGNDMTANYAVTEKPGVLTVKDPNAPGNGSQGTGSGTSIGGNGGDENLVVMKLFSTKNALVYMRQKSYGNYTGNGWEGATPYDTTFGGPYSMNYLISTALAEKNFDRTELKVEFLECSYALPYYLAIGEYSYEQQSSDVEFFGKTDQPIALEYYGYDYKGAPTLLASVPADYQQIEQLYREFVKAQYLQIPDATKAYMQGIIEAEGFRLDDPEVIAKVASYVQGAAIYDAINYDPALNEEEDIAVAFLEEYKMGHCQHFSTAATMLFRALGLPARYTVGFVGETVANDWSDVTGDKGHAWVEVYLDGIGWVCVEVTGGSGGSGGSGGAGGAGGISGGLAETNDDEDKVYARLYADKASNVYLRWKSFGDFDGKQWGEATAYQTLLGGVYSMDYLLGISFREMGYSAVEVKVEPLSPMYMLPYYLDPEGQEYAVQTNDTMFMGKTKDIYVASYYAYNYAGAPTLIAKVPTQYEEAEQAYRKFVHDNYLNVPQTTVSLIKTIAEEQGFDASDKDIVLKVASYIQKAATYNKDYDKSMDQAQDIVVAFLSQYKEGVCRHYASAATLLYRYLGIPARYTTGFVGETAAGEWTDVKGESAHAWVEVYLDGYGWVQVEVTGGSQNIPGEGDSEAEDKIESDFVITPETLYMPYDGVSVLDASVQKPALMGTMLQQLTDKGYTYEVVFSGSQSEVGFGASVIESFILRDPAGADVTDQFDIVLKQGKLHVYLREIEIQSHDKTQEYNAQALLPDADGYTITGELLESTHRVEVTFISSQTVAGKTANRFTAVVLDADGNDVSYMYKINAKNGTLTVTHISLTLTANNASKKYDGTPLEQPLYSITRTFADKTTKTEKDVDSREYTLLEGILCDGHRIYAVIECVDGPGTAINQGRKSNVIRSVVIVDTELRDVTSNYTLNLKSGWLSIR